VCCVAKEESTPPICVWRCFFGSRFVLKVFSDSDFQSISVRLE
jgi:hypothetical protein